MSEATRVIQSSLYPPGILKNLIHSSPSPFQTTLLLTILYTIELGKAYIGIVGQKILYIIWKVLIENRQWGRHTSNKTNPKERERNKLKSNERLRQDKFEKEFDYEEIYDQHVCTEEFIPLKTSLDDGTHSSKLPSSGETLSDEKTVKSSAQQPPLRTFKTKEEDRLSKKGNILDIDKLRRNGYNRYRFVSHSFVKRNNLSSDPCDYEGED